MYDLKTNEKSAKPLFDKSIKTQGKSSKNVLTLAVQFQGGGQQAQRDVQTIGILVIVKLCSQ